mmetsp:Transcript_218/g.477  ORF Transcript_218/g.477 Transcript_218/m.477 type:complete len:145 (-) Transcript_218:132-566(-)
MIVISRLAIRPLARAWPARQVAKCISTQPYAVSRPGGDFAFAEFDQKDIAESSAWARRIVEVASVTEDAEAINEMHDSVLKTHLYAVDAPDGEHDLEDVEEHHRGVESIILNASIFEKPDQVVKQQNMRAEVLKKQMRDLEGDM